MKRLVGWGLVLSLLVFTAAASAADKDMEEQKKLLKAAKKELNNLEWKIKLSPMSGTKAKSYEDTLLFVDSKFSSEKLESEEFSASNYTVSLKGEDVIVWETMQTSEDAGISFWRGELENGVMRGVLSKNPGKETHMDFSFYSIERKELAGKSSPVEEVEEKLIPKLEEVQQEVVGKIEEVPEKTEEKIEEKPAPKKRKHWWQR